MDTKLLEKIKQKNQTPSTIAKELGVSTSQIYRWAKHGISANNKHYKKLEQLIPNIIPKEVRLRTNGKEDTRYNSGRKQTKLKLADTDLQEYTEPQFNSELFPKIIIKRK